MIGRWPVDEIGKGVKILPNGLALLVPVRSYVYVYIYVLYMGVRKRSLGYIYTYAYIAYYLYV